MPQRCVIDQDGVDRINFFSKSNEILKFLHDIEKFFTWEERKVLDQAADIISGLMHKKMNDQSENQKNIDLVD